jgi:carbon-monoxide dehydrogenase small subunit
VNGKAVKACTVFVWQIEGADVLTIEGLADPNGPLHPMQEAFRENHGLQCGYCTPGMIMTAVDMVYRKGHDLDDPTIRHELEGNLCRCTGYHNIVGDRGAPGYAGQPIKPAADADEMKVTPIGGGQNHCADRRVAQGQ